MSTATAPHITQSPLMGRPIYKKWEDVPDTLATRTTLMREGLTLPDVLLASPAAYCRRHGGTYPLYARAWALPRVNKHPRRDYTAQFSAEYDGDWCAALPIACDSLFQLNRYAKHPECSDRRKVTIYALKNRLIETLWHGGYCVQAYLAHSPTKELTCYSCGGTGKSTWNEYDDDGDDFDPEEDCRRCDGTGVYRTVGGNPYWALRFRIGTEHGPIYQWHQPARLAPWATTWGEQPAPDAVEPVTISVEEVTLKPYRHTEALALIKWVCDRAEQERSAQNREVADALPF